MLNTFKNFFKTVKSFFEEPVKEQIPTEQPKDFVKPQKTPVKVSVPKQPVVKPAQTKSTGNQTKRQKKK